MKLKQQDKEWLEGICGGYSRDVIDWIEKNFEYKKSCKECGRKYEPLFGGKSEYCPTCASKIGKKVNPCD